MRNAGNLFATLLVIVSMSSCATMFGGSKYTANVEVKDHPEAEISIDNRVVGAAGKGSKLVKRSQAVTIKIEEEGCKDFSRTYDKKFRGTIFLNLLQGYGFWIGTVVDLATGASFKPDTDDPEVDKISTNAYKFTIDYDDYCLQEKPVETSSN